MNNYFLNTNGESSGIPIHGGNLSQEAHRLKVRESQLLDASASLVPFNPPKSFDGFLLKALRSNSLRNYPDCSYQYFREAIGAWHKINPASILPGNGAAELITWAARDATNTGISTLIAPSFNDYERALNCWQGRYIYIELPLHWTTNSPQAFPLLPKTDVIWITNPHNPTGHLWSRASLEPLLKWHKLVICDEAFLSLVPNGEEQSLLPLVENYTNLIVLRSLTKLFSIAGLRLGYAVSANKRLKEWQSWRDPWPVNGIATAAGTMLMNDHITLNRWTKKIHNWVEKEGLFLQEKLKKIPEIKSYPSSSNFQLIKGNQSLLSLREALAQKKILLRDCRSFKGLGENWLRISLQTRSNNIRISSTIKYVMGKDYQSS